jgi:hypothetical protein
LALSTAQKDAVLLKPLPKETRWMRRVKVACTWNTIFGSLPIAGRKIMADAAA